MTIDDFTLQELEIFSSIKRVNIIRDFQGSYRKIKDVVNRVHVSTPTVIRVVDLGLDAGYLENKMVGQNRYMYKATEKFNKRYHQLKQTLYEQPT